MWTQLILIWLALNVVLVLLLWWRSSKPGKDRDARHELPLSHPPIAPFRSQPPGPAPRPQPRPIRLHQVQAAADWPSPASRSVALAVMPCGEWQGEPTPSRCRLRELQAEIRELRLTVAELSLDKARLSSAIARQRC